MIDVITWLTLQLYIAKYNINKSLNSPLYISLRSSAGKALILYSKGCWFDLTVRHHFSSNNVSVLAYVLTGEYKQSE